MPKVSVVIPFYNPGIALKTAIQSIAGQSLSDFECILVDNNSSDGSHLIAEEFCKNDSRFILVSENRQGVSYASNKGSKLAQSDIIARMDADDFAYPDRLEKQYRFLQNHPDYAAVCSAADFGGDKEAAAGLNRFVDWSNSLNSYEDIFIKRFIESPVINPTAMWRKSAENTYGSFIQGDFPEDYELWLRWLDQGAKIGKINQPLIIWNDPPTRLTRSDDRYSFNAFYKTKTHYLAKHLKRTNPHHPKVLVWGASRIMRKRALLLAEHGIQIAGFIDITEKRIIDEEIIHYLDIPSPDKAFILTYVPQPEIRQQVEDFLKSRGYKEGKNFLFVA